MQKMNFKDWVELQEGLGNFMLPMMLGAATPSAPPTQPPAAMVEKPSVENELLRAIQQRQKQIDAEKFKADDSPELVKYAQNTRDALNTLEDHMSSAIKNGQIRIDPSDDNFLKIHHYFDELRTRLDTFIAPDNFEHLAAAFDNKDKKYIIDWMDKINELQKKFMIDKEQTYQEFMKEYPNLLKKAEMRAMHIRGSHPEDSKTEYERYQKEIEAEIQGKRRR